MTEPANQRPRPAGGWLTPVGLVVAPVARIAYGVTVTAVALSGLYHFIRSFPSPVLLGALAAPAARPEAA